MRLIPIILSLIFMSVPLFSEDEVKWSTYQGKKTYQEAKDHCQNMQMRLPTIDELKQAQEAGTTKSWIKNGSRYWAVNKDLSKKNSIYYNALSLQEMDNKGKVEIHRVESQLGLFCANVTEESVKKDLERLELEEPASFFSEYQGYMSWDEANLKCKSLNMRLPTIYELKVYHERVTNSWLVNGQGYWSSNSYDSERYYYFYVYDRDIYSKNENRREYENVRCHR